MNPLHYFQTAVLINEFTAGKMSTLICMHCLMLLAYASSCDLSFYSEAFACVLLCMISHTLKVNSEICHTSVHQLNP